MKIISKRAGYFSISIGIFGSIFTYIYYLSEDMILENDKNILLEMIYFLFKYFYGTIFDPIKDIIFNIFSSIFGINTTSVCITLLLMWTIIGFVMFSLCVVLKYFIKR